ncbi:Serine/threonine-protein phosphatase [Phytophthora cinnamomi]|uniref:Serine/threonine-protein phosphatase n=1 Tax=Phytophthora cinnamomi TaxID=4785 RepID=UPI003559F7C9|nr:Serine/threonine-protein phosphatase [Phytophthora cinnamomi]
MENSAALRRELQQLSPAQLRELLSASGHGQLLREEQAEQQTAADEQLAAAAKSEGNAFFRQGQMQDAVAAYSRCIALDPTNAVCLSNRAAAYLKLKQFDFAVADCSKAIEVVPTIKPFMRRAAAYIELREFGCAVDDLVAALEFEPRNKECHAKLQSIVDAAVDKMQRMEASGDAELRYAGVRAAVIASLRHGDFSGYCHVVCNIQERFLHLGLAMQLCRLRRKMATE